MEMKFIVPMQFLLLVLGGNTDSSVAGLNLFVLGGDDHGGEAVVGHWDANWASGRSTITSSLLLSVLWAVGSLVLIGMTGTRQKFHDQRGDSNLTISCALHYFLPIHKSIY